MFPEIIRKAQLKQQKATKGKKCKGERTHL